jgi:hypothetical protein
VAREIYMGREYRLESTGPGSARVEPTAPLYWHPEYQPHLMIAGQSGGGKSWFLDAALDKILQDPASLDLVSISDPKGSTFGHLADHPRVARLVSPYTMGDCYSTAMAFCDEQERDMEVRKAQIAIVGGRMPDYLKAGLPLHYWVREETNAEMCCMSSKERKEYQERLIALAAITRSYGHAMVIVGQSLHSDLLPTLLKLNMGSVVIVGPRLSRGDYVAVFGEDPPKDYIYTGGRGRGLALLDSQITPIVSG